MLNAFRLFFDILKTAHCVSKDAAFTSMSSSGYTGTPRNIYPACCADANSNHSPRWDLTHDDAQSCGHEVTTTDWSDVRRLPWNAGDTGYKSSTVFSPGSGTPAIATSAWNRGCGTEGTTRDGGARRTPPTNSAGQQTAAGKYF